MGLDMQTVTGRSEYAAVARALVSGARRQLDLLSYNLDRNAYGSADFVEAVKLLLLSSQAARLRVLVNQPRLAMLKGHALIELGRQISSRVEFRELPPERLDDNRGELLIVDQRDVLEQREHGGLEARLWRDAADLARKRGEFFDLLWAESLPSHELRQLHL